MNLLLHRRQILICACFAAATTWAADPARGSKEEAKALAEAAAAHVNKVGGDQAFKDFADPKWHPKDLYVFAQNMDAVMLYHGANEKLVGKNFSEVKDSAGKEFGKEMIATAKKGAGWVDYQWAHPATKKVEDKTSYVVRINQPDGYVGVGVYR